MDRMRGKRRSGIWMALTLAIPLALGACASQNTEAERELVAETRDPIEPLNRYVFAFNQGVDTVVFRPLAVWYRIVVPEPLRLALRNGYNNANLPWIFINELLQREYGRAQITSTRFLINTTLGIGGLLDWATVWGYPQHYEDFGLTLARVFGMGEGPYLMLPLLGPSNVRDGLGRVVDTVGDPVGWILPFPGGIVRAGVEAVDTRAQNIETLDELQRGSLDFYATIRSVIRQRREAEINRGAIGSNLPRVGAEAPGAPQAFPPRGVVPVTPRVASPRELSEATPWIQPAPRGRRAN